MRRVLNSNAGALAVTVLLALLLLMVLQTCTRDAIVAGEQRFLKQQIAEVIPGVAHDNKAAEAYLAFSLPDSPTPYRVYPLTSADELSAIAVVLDTPPAYTAPIRLLVGIDSSGTLLGVRVIAHRETPGLGDVIDARRSDWIEQFAGHRPDSDFDHVTGATITSATLIRTLSALPWQALLAETRRALEKQNHEH